MRQLNNQEVNDISGGLYVDIGIGVYPPSIYYPPVVEVIEIYPVYPSVSYVDVYYDPWGYDVYYYDDYDYYGYYDVVYYY